MNKEEFLEELGKSLGGISLFIRINENEETYKRLDLLEYLGTVLTGATVIIREPAKAPEKIPEKASGKTKEKPTEKPAATGKDGIKREMTPRKTMPKKDAVKASEKRIYQSLDKGRIRALFNAGWPKNEIVEDLYNNDPKEVAKEVDRLEKEKNEGV